MRGKHTLKKLGELLTPEDNSTILQPSANSLYEEKCKCIAARYYYYHSQKMNYEDILIKLQSEFYVSTGTIATIVTRNVEEVKKLREQAPKRSWFATQWAHLIW